MSATEIIEQIKQLPLKEQEQVVAFVRNLAGAAGGVLEEPSVRYIDEAKAKAVSQEVFIRHAKLFRKLAE